MNNGSYPGVAVQDFVNQYGGAADTVHVEDGAWIFPETDYGSPYFLKWVEPPAKSGSSNCVYNTQIDCETPGFTTKFYSWAPVMAGANWCETAEQIWTNLNGAGSVAAWKIQDPYNNLVDGNYVSARWPGDAHTLARTFLQVLKESRYSCTASPIEWRGKRRSIVL